MKLEIESRMPAAEGGAKTRTDVAAIRDAIVDPTFQRARHVSHRH
jgi:hypothetical protein